MSMTPYKQQPPPTATAYHRNNNNNNNNNNTSYDSAASTDIPMDESHSSSASVASLTNIDSPPPATRSTSTTNRKDRFHMTNTNTPRTRLLFGDDDDDDDDGDNFLCKNKNDLGVGGGGQQGAAATPLLPFGKQQPRSRALMKKKKKKDKQPLDPLDTNDLLNDSAELSTASSNNSTGSLTSLQGGGRKRSSAERRGGGQETTGTLRTPRGGGGIMMECSGGGNDDDGGGGNPTNCTNTANNSMYASPRISPNSFITMDGRFVQSKNPFSSPMMTDTPTSGSGGSAATNQNAFIVGSATQHAPPLPVSFYGGRNGGMGSGGGESKSFLPPRPGTAGSAILQPKQCTTPATDAAESLQAFHFGYPDRRFCFTGSPIPEHPQAAVAKAAAAAKAAIAGRSGMAAAPGPPPPHHHNMMESTDAASSGSLHKVRRLNLSDDVVAATGHHLSSLSRRVTDHPLLGNPSMEDNNNDDGISPTDVINVPAFAANAATPVSKKLPPPTPMKQRPTHQPYYCSSLLRPRSNQHRYNRSPPVLNRKSSFSKDNRDDDDDDDDDGCSSTGAAGKSSNNKSRFHSDFDVIGELGKGSFGAVYKVLSRLDGCMYAIKAAHRQAKGAADRDRMLKEVYALAALSDQADTANFHIVRYHQAWMEDDRLYIQTELCSGTLSDEMAQGGLTPQRRYKLLREILLALEFIHRNNMVHLDIKPDNVFLKNDQYKLGDFGLVTKLSASQDVEEGDSRYMSMELLSGDRSDLTKSDIFSLGATMYELCLGRPLPMNGQEWQDIRAGKLEHLPPSTDRDLANILQRMMDPVPANRPTPSMLLKHPQLLSDEQKALNAEKTKVMHANMQLAAHQQRMGAVPKRQLTRANTWSGASLPFL